MGEEEVGYDLCVEGPVAGVVEGEDCVDFEVGSGDWGGRGGEGVVEGQGEGLRGEGGCGGGLEGEDCWGGGVDVGGGDDCLEAVAGRGLVKTERR